MAAKKKKVVRKAGKPARKPTTRKAAPKKRSSTEPVPVKTGRGPAPAEIGASLVRMFNDGKLKEIEDMFWSPAVVSVEGMGMEMAWNGRKAVEGKNNWWMENHTIHSAAAKGPFVGASGFAVHFTMDVEDKSNGKRGTMTEVGVYTVKDGKIVREEFMYSVD